MLLQREAEDLRLNSRHRSNVFASTFHHHPRPNYRRPGLAWPASDYYRLHHHPYDHVLHHHHHHSHGTVAVL